MDWQPIETAPDTLDEVLVANAARVYVAWRSSSEDKWIDALSGEWGDPVEPSPTHWMPLPKPPKADNFKEPTGTE